MSPTKKKWKKSVHNLDARKGRGKEVRMITGQMSIEQSMTHYRTIGRQVIIGHLQIVPEPINTDSHQSDSLSSSVNNTGRVL